MIYYILIVFAQPATMNPVPLYMETDRKLTFTECRTRRSQEITFWEMLRDQPVSVLCIKADYKEE